jgi:hypothetical protein
MIVHQARFALEVAVQREKADKARTPSASFIRTAVDPHPITPENTLALLRLSALEPTPSFAFYGWVFAFFFPFAVCQLTV